LISIIICKILKTGLKVTKILKTGFIISSIFSILYAQDTDIEKRDRISSVKKAIGSVGKLEEKDVGVVEKLKRMLSDGKVSGQIRGVYAE
jgi:chemotaxis signal transduction protein